MTAKSWTTLALVICVAGTLGAGCKRTHAKGLGDGVNGDTSLLGPGGTTGLGGDNGLGTKGGTGTLVDGQFQTVLFDFDSAQIGDSERAKVQQVAEYLKTNPSALVVVNGYTDERGSAEYNMALGERRALAVREALVALGADASKIQTRSFGEEQPKAPGHDEASWTQNRRAEFSVGK